MVDYLIEKITDHEEEDAEEENKNDNTKKKGIDDTIDNNRKEVVQELLLQVYMKLPNCLVHLTSDPASLSRLLPAEGASSVGNTSVVDCISHTVLSALAATQHGRSWVR